MSELIITTSWDDGQTTDLKLAELLAKYGVKGTFYISKYYRNPLGKQDVARIDREHEIGAHGLSHVDLLVINASEVETEIKGSKAYLEDLVGHSVSMFCYPYGRYNKDVKQIVKGCGFIAARTCEPGGFNPPQDPYQWHITLYASNNSPLMALRIWWKYRLRKVGGLLDWESRAKLLFDLALVNGGIYHMYGHSAEFEKNNGWDKLDRVLTYISNIGSAHYMTNGDIFRHFSG